MNKSVIKKVALGIVGLLVLAVAGTLVYFYGFLPKSRPAPDVKAPVDKPEALARGEYLATILGCKVCHTPIDEERPGDQIVESKLLAGREFDMGPDFPGKVRAPNLTPDKESGIGAWTDGEVLRAIREGVSRDGRALFPMMNYPAFRNLPDDDALAIIAYLRSVPPIESAVPQTEIQFPVSMFIRAVPEPVEAPPAPWSDDPKLRGEMLLKMMSCGECHTPMKRGKPVEGMTFAGGNCFEMKAGKVCASNITSHPAAGIGSMSDEDLVRVFREGRGKDGHTLWVMPWSATKALSDEDLRALIAGLRAVPPNANVPPASEIKPEYQNRK